jgi:hypothetical protein
MKDLYKAFKFNQKPEEPKFKVGDYAYTETGYLGTIVGQTHKYIAIDVKDDIYYNDPNKIKPWQPQEDEWCWFYNDDMSIPVFDLFFNTTPKGKYKSYHSHGVRDCNKWQHCEPFIGNLPAHLKEQE